MKGIQVTDGDDISEREPIPNFNSQLKKGDNKENKKKKAKGKKEEEVK